MGSWWSGLALLLLCFLQLFLESRYVHFPYFIYPTLDVYDVYASLSPLLYFVACLSIGTLIICIVGSVLDGIFWHVMNTTGGCYNPYSDSYFGDPQLQSAAESCADKTSIGDSNTNNLCFCVQDSLDFCFHYRLIDADSFDCSDIITTYRDWLRDSMSLGCSMIFFCSIYFILICKGGCVMSGDFPDSEVLAGFSSIPENESLPDEIIHNSGPNESNYGSNYTKSSADTSISLDIRENEDNI